MKRTLKRILTRQFIWRICQRFRAKSIGGRRFDRFIGHTERVPGIQSRSSGRGTWQLFAAVEPTPGHYCKGEEDWGGIFTKGWFQS